MSIRIPRMYSLPADGALVLFDVECEIEARVEFRRFGEPELIIEGVYLTKFHTAAPYGVVGEANALNHADPLLKALADKIVAAAKLDDELFDLACEDEGLARRGSGPDAHWFRARQYEDA